MPGASIRCHWPKSQSRRPAPGGRSAPRCRSTPKERDRYVEGQIQGGVAQGIGWALNEEYIYDKQGRLDNPGFLDYRVPVASDLPMIDAVIVEVPNPRHPFGVRGVGEVPIVPPMAAVANAIHAATGMRLRDLPMSPPKILAEIDAEEPRRLAAE
jgi:CO/xanthine dehydrogenase Mo-binding subunit